MLRAAVAQPLLMIGPIENGCVLCVFFKWGSDGSGVELMAARDAPLLKWDEHIGLSTGFCRSLAGSGDGVPSIH